MAKNKAGIKLPKSDLTLLKAYGKQAGVWEYGPLGKEFPGEAVAVTAMAYGDAGIIVSLDLSKGKCTKAYFDLSQVYEKYGRGMFANTIELVRALQKEHGFYEIERNEKDGTEELAIDPVKYNDEESVCNVLAHFGLLNYALNKILHRNEEDLYEEKNIVSLYGQHIDKLVKLKFAGLIGSGVLGVLCIIIGASGSAFGWVLLVLALVGAAYCFLGWKSDKKFSDKLHAYYQKIK